MSAFQFRLLLIAAEILTSSLAPSPVEAAAPVFGQPPNSIGAEGPSFAITMQASPREVQVDDPFLLTLRIAALGPWQQVPRRPDLAGLPEFHNGDFLIEHSETVKPDRVAPREHAWEFDYHVRPRKESITEVPDLVLSYYNPHIPFEDKRWQAIPVNAIPLRVLPRKTVQRSEVQGAQPIQFPGRFYHIAEGSAVLRHEEVERFPDPNLLAVFLLGPPVCCLAWYLIWRQRYPDAGQKARRRRSRSAREALKTIHAANGRPGLTPEKAAAVLTRYLEQRAEWVTAQPTPAETTAHLQAVGCSAVLTRQVAEFFEACDAARFAPHSALEQVDWSVEAVRLIHALEAEVCLSKK